MTTPFVSEFAPEILRELLTPPDGFDMVDLMLRFIEQYNDLYGEIDEGETTQLVDKRDCIRIWIIGCLVDSDLNGTDDSAHCKGFEDEYRLALKALEEALKRTQKRFLRKPVPVHDVRYLATEVFDCLLCIDDDGSTELCVGMSDEEYLETALAITDLNDRLEPYLDRFKRILNR